MWYVNATFANCSSFLPPLFYINYVVCKFAIVKHKSLSTSVGFILTMWYVNKIK